MSYREALEDDVVITKDGKGNTWYHPPCHICGAPVESWSYLRNVTYTCPDCRKELIMQEREYGKVLSASAKQKKMDAAIKRISKVADIAKYDRAIAIVSRNLDKRGWFQSTEEIMTAMELIRCGIKTYHQVKVYDYIVDFVLPEYKVALEIDGKPYHGKDKEGKRLIRDELIADKFGAGWEVVHIDTKNINENVTRLVPAIKAVLARRKSKEDSKVHLYAVVFSGSISWERGIHGEAITGEILWWLSV